jgi:hypothetical protein
MNGSARAYGLSIGLIQRPQAQTACPAPFDEFPPKPLMSKGSRPNLQSADYIIVSSAAVL